MSIEAARNALARAGIDPAEIRAVWVGSESHPYAVKPTSTIVAEAIGATPHTQAADWEFACKAGTEGAAGGDRVCRFGDGPLRAVDRHGHRAGTAGRRARVHRRRRRAPPICSVRPRKSLAIFEGSYSYATDTPDFWRRADEKYPEHGERFTGEPAYFKHITEAAEAIMADPRHDGRPTTAMSSSTSRTPSSRSASASHARISSRSRSRPACWSR